MKYGLHDSQVEIEEKVKKRKVVDLGPIMLDAERCVLCSRCLRFESTVTGTNTFEFVNRGDHTSIATFENGPITHDYAGNLADVCPVGALLSHDFRFKMRVWFLKSHDSVCPGCSTGCNIQVDERDGEVQRLRPRRNVDVNKSWMCDLGRASYKEIAVQTRVTGARLKGASSWAGHEPRRRPRRGGGEDQGSRARPRPSWPPRRPPTRTSSPSPRLAERGQGPARLPGGRPRPEGPRALRQGAPARGPQPQHPGLPRPGPGAHAGWPRSSKACRDGKVKALVLQGPELLRQADAADALAKVPFIAVMATHEGPELERAHAVLPAAVWAEVRGHLHQLPASRAARAARGARPGRGHPAVGARRGPARAAGPAPGGHLGPRGVRPMVAAR